MLGRMKDEATYWMLRAYTSALKAVGNASEITSEREWKKHR